ncbi:MAG: TonB-dependent receptor [Proteobacteria bacterium]|nr:TonB-dependent receptor [Pseudomonadota bacterium]
MIYSAQSIVLLTALLGCWSSYCFGQQSNRILEEISVLGERLYYSLNNSPAPKLNYEKGFFQSFEPQSVGDMLKRVSGVAFTADIGEFEAPQLRGLGPQYTQVLINGERIPGSSDDRTALVDRIPAELIERIEVIRSPTPDLDAQGVGGTINLILKEGADIQGNEFRLGGLYYSDLDPTLKGSAAFTHGGNNDAWSYLISANVQERLGPKTKTENVFDNAGSLIRVVNADDLRDSNDASFTSSVTYRFGAQEALNVRLAYLRNRIDEKETIEFLDGEFALDANGIERRHTDQDRVEFGLQYNRMMARDTNLQLSFSGSQFDDDSQELEAVLEEGIEVIELQQFTAADDLEMQFVGSLTWRVKENHEIKVGLGASNEDRDAKQTLNELDEDELVDNTPGNGLYHVEEMRLHAYIKDAWNVSGNATLEYGLRAEDTSLDQTGSEGRAENSQFELIPSVHLSYQVGDSGAIRVSLARTLRRPSFNEIIPFSNLDTPDEDQVTVGNPGLQPEIAAGIDLGYSYRFDNNAGIFGVNLFYREIDDKIELTKVGDDLFTPDNVGRGETWGLELDFGMPLAIIGLPQVSFFTNYTLIDSEIKDPFTNETRRFNLQPNFIGNIDLIHNVPSLGFSHGLSIQKQGGMRDIQIDEIKSVSYDSNLEYFIEKSLGENFMLRLSVNNMLDARKRENGNLYEGLAALRDGEVEEVVFEREQSEPVFLLTIRGSF